VGEWDLRPLLVRSTGCFVIELKTGEFQPKYAGKLKFYIVLIDDRLRREAQSLSRARRRDSWSVLLV
jgi:hypothetical protein